MSQLMSWWFLCSQNFLRCQNNKNNYNLVCETLQFLDIMCGSTTGGLGLLGLYINESNVHLIIQTLETLTEYCQGPCQENQVLQHTVRPKVSEQSLLFKQSLCGGQFRSPSPAFFISSKPRPTHGCTGRKGPGPFDHKVFLLWAVRRACSPGLHSQTVIRLSLTPELGVQRKTDPRRGFLFFRHVSWLTSPTASTSSRRWSWTTSAHCVGTGWRWFCSWRYSGSAALTWTGRQWLQITNQYLPTLTSPIRSRLIRSDPVWSDPISFRLGFLTEITQIF